jgi:hypothetical protein
MKKTDDGEPSRERARQREERRERARQHERELDAEAARAEAALPSAENGRDLPRGTDGEDAVVAPDSAEET